MKDVLVGDLGAAGIRIVRELRRPPGGTAVALSRCPMLETCPT